MGDVGVFPQSESAREMVLMQAAGTAPIRALIAATLGNARIFNIADKADSVKAGPIAVPDDPTRDRGQTIRPGE
jgi:imidazolonepropionase-like amidohydrolase